MLHYGDGSEDAVFLVLLCLGLFGFPWLIFSKEFLTQKWVFSLLFTGFLCIRQGKKILGKFGGFPWWKQNNQP